MISFTRVFSRALDLLIPPRLSERTVASLSFESMLPLAAMRERGEIRFMLPYRDKRVRALVWELKYHANTQARRLAAICLVEEIIGISADELGTVLLIPIPLHKSRRAARGFSQTESLCEELMRLLPDAALRYAPHVLTRTRETLPQQGLLRKARLTNPANSMQAAAEVANMTCIVLDDVATTGATLLEAWRALENAGAARIHLLALAG